MTSQRDIVRAALERDNQRDVTPRRPPGDRRTHHRAGDVLDAEGHSGQCVYCGHVMLDLKAELRMACPALLGDPLPTHAVRVGGQEPKALMNVVKAARELDALFSGDGPGRWKLDGRYISDGSITDALLSLHDYLNDVEIERDRAVRVGVDRQGWRARLANVERLLSEIEIHGGVEHVRDIRTDGVVRLRAALVEVRSMIDDIGTEQ